MEDKYLVLPGNEYGIDLLDIIDLTFLSLEKAEELYESNLEEYFCAGMWKVESDKLTLIKADNNFN